MMKLAAALLCGLSLLAVSTAQAATPCDFKGLSVGDKMTPAQIMSSLGVTRYKMNPDFPSIEKMEPSVKRYGLIVSSEMQDWNIGPFCEADYCKVPYGVGIGNRDTPVSVYVGTQHGVIVEIDASFGETYWDDVLPMLNLKYGDNWSKESYRDVITNYETKESTLKDVVSLNHIPNGTNVNTGDRCEIWAKNIDLVFEHHDALGPYHSQIVITLISKNL